jgi:hypothetical protein
MRPLDNRIHYPAMRYRTCMGNARAKTISTQVVEISRKKDADVLEVTGAAHIGALQDFVSQEDADHSPRERETAGQMPRKWEQRLRITRCLPGFQTSSFFG